MKLHNKKITLLMLMIISIFALTSCGKKDEFVVGFDAEFPPYGSIDVETGEYVGFDLDLAREVCRRNGWKFKAQPIDWNSKDMELNSGTIDCIWNGFTIDGREDSYTWSKAYVDNSQVIVVRADSDIYTLDDLKGKHVIVQSDSSALAAFTGEDATPENIALAESFSDLDKVPDYNMGFMMLETKSVHALGMDIGAAKYNIEARGGGYRILEETISSEQYGIGFKLGNTELRDQVQETLDEMLADGTFMEIATAWGLEESVCLGEEGTDHAYMLDADPNVTRTHQKKDFVKEIKEIVNRLPKGIAATLLIFFATLAFSLPLGLLICTIRMSKLKILKALATIYISIVRGTPLMLQLFVVFFGPYYVFGMDLSYEYRVYAVVIAFSLNYAAYFAEIYRGGFQSIPNGQKEAASVLGLSKTQTYWKILFPQMVKRVIPSVTNEVITLVKDTSLAFAITYEEMFTIAQDIAAAKASITALFVAGFFYYIFNVIVAFVMSRIEKKLNYYN